MKILFVASEVPYPPDNGVRIVSHHAMRLMHGKGHELALAVLSEEQDAHSLDDRLRAAASYCGTELAWREALAPRRRAGVALRAALGARMFFMERYRSAEFRERLQRLIGEFRPDVVHFDLILMTQYLDVVPPGVGAVASINDSYTLTLDNGLSAGQYAGLELWYRRAQRLQAARYETAIYPRFDAVHVVSRVDGDFLERLSRRIPVSVIPNGVDDSLLRMQGSPGSERTALFIGTLQGDNAFHLGEFLEHGWKLVRDSLPDARLNVAGRLLLEGEALRRRYLHWPEVRFLGYMGEISRAYRDCGIAVIPVNKTSGLVNKALEAMAAGHVAIGFRSAFLGIPEAVESTHFIGADGYREIGEKLVAVLRNGTLAAAIRAAARKLAADHYSWDRRAADFHGMYCAAAAAALRRSASIATEPSSD